MLITNLSSFFLFNRMSVVNISVPQWSTEIRRDSCPEVRLLIRLGEKNKLQRKPGQDLYFPRRISAVKASPPVSDCRKLVWLEISLCCHCPLLQLINVAASFNFCPLAGKKENYSFRKRWIKADECMLMILSFFFFFGDGLWGNCPLASVCRGEWSCALRWNEWTLGTCLESTLSMQC